MANDLKIFIIDVSLVQSSGQSADVDDQLALYGLNEMNPRRSYSIHP